MSKRCILIPLEGEVSVVSVDISKGEIHKILGGAIDASYLAGLREHPRLTLFGLDMSINQEINEVGSLVIQFLRASRIEVWNTFRYSKMRGPCLIIDDDKDLTMEDWKFMLSIIEKRNKFFQEAL